MFKLKDAYISSSVLTAGSIYRTWDGYLNAAFY